MKPRRLIRLYGVLLAFVLLAAIVRAQTEAEVKAHYTKTEQAIAMRDGVKLFTSIYVPKDKSKKYPIMLNRTPYSVAPYGITRLLWDHRCYFKRRATYLSIRTCAEGADSE